MFNNVLKSGCRSEESKLKTPEGLAKLIVTLYIVECRIFRMTMLQRENTTEEPAAVLLENELNICVKLVKLRVTKRVNQRACPIISGKWPNLGVT